MLFRSRTDLRAPPPTHAVCASTYIQHIQHIARTVYQLTGSIARGCMAVLGEAESGDSKEGLIHYVGQERRPGVSVRVQSETSLGVIPQSDKG